MTPETRRAISRQDHDERRGSASSRGYGAAWRAARDQFLRDHPLCAEHGKRGDSIPAQVVDHIVAPRLAEARESGDPERMGEAQRLFWSRSNWQPLCKLCHDSDKQRLEKSGRIAGCAPDGRPLDPRHPWNRPAASTISAFLTRSGPKPAPRG